jgi:hypothetical protein
MDPSDAPNPRGQISAGWLRALAEQVRRDRPTPGSGEISTSAGRGTVDDGDDVFLAKVTAVSGTGSAAAYGFKEQNVVPGTGGAQDRLSGRSGGTTVNPARFPGTTTFAVNDLVLMRRNVAGPNEFEILPAGGASITPNCDSAAATHWKPSCDTGSLVLSPYTDTTEVCIDAAGALTVTVTRVGP